MINVYDDVMDTNLVIPRGVDKTEVVFRLLFRRHVRSGPGKEPRQHRRQ